jgi:hypothetical protein
MSVIVNQELVNNSFCENKIEVKLDYWKDKEKVNIKSNVYSNISIFKIFTDKLPIENQPQKNLFILQSGVYKKKILQPLKYDEVAKVILTIVDKKNDAIVFIDGVEFKGVKFISVSPNIVPKVIFPVYTINNIENMNLNNLE